METLDLNYTLDSNEPNRHTQNVPSNSSRLHILPKHAKTFSRIDHMLGHKTSLNKFKKTEIISRIFSNHNDMKLVINNRRKTRKFTNMWK